ncbi:MAG: YhcH/YjgK/YiaL family protein [Nitrospinota bacterium]|nr:YhcH/YjgK/YiaL family protein [Nitrospinota bacterium]
MAIIGRIENPEKAHIESNIWIEAFKYIRSFLYEGSETRERLLSMEPGDVARVELSDGLFAMEQVYMTKEEKEGRFESHRKYIDIQAVIAGNEIAQTSDIKVLTVETPYDEEKDVTFYKDGVDKAEHLLSSGIYAVFYPSDAHKPCLMRNKSEIVYKTVVKVPIEKL